jgi:hypothetical protein
MQRRCYQGKGSVSDLRQRLSRGDDAVEKLGDLTAAPGSTI